MNEVPSTIGKGAVLVAVAVVGLVIGLVGGGTEDVKDVTDEVVGVAGVGVDNPCPKGWEYEPGRSQDIRVAGCKNTITNPNGTKTTWRVFLNADNKFSHALQEDTPGAQFVFDAKLVPGWVQ